MPGLGAGMSSGAECPRLRGQPARVLVVDDEAAERYLVGQYLRQEGYLVEEAVDGTQALECVRRCPVDLALVDVMMPGVDGFEFVRSLRGSSDIPVIFVTARGEETQRVAGLELGADDYVVKPFSPAELVARVRAHLRRSQGLLGGDDEKGEQAVLSAAGISVSRDERRCYLHGETVELTRREFDLLVELIDHPGQVRTRGQLLAAAWGETFLGEKTVDVHLAALRRKLGDELRVTALRGVGYRLEPT